MRRNIIIPNRKRPWTKSPLVAIFLLLLLIWGCIVVVRIYFKYHEAVVFRNQSQSDLAELKIKESELNTKIANLSTDRGIEAEVRDRYRVVKPGEQLVIVVGATSSTTTETVTSSEPWWQKLLAFVGF
jgi:cell division protein FtsB